MASKQADELKSLYRGWSVALSGGMPLDEWRDMVERWEVVTAEPGGVDYLEIDAGGVPAMWAVPKGCAADRVLLCLHGGGFVVGSMYTHRKLFGHIAKAAGARALIPDFRRPPEHVHPAPLEDTVAAYSWLLEQGIDASHVAFTGDSAGGGLAITALLRAREQGLPLPAAAMPFSPWVDMEYTGESLVSNQGKDALFAGKEAIQALAGIFLGEGGSPQDPLANPLYAGLAGLPPVYIQVSGDELLLDDSRRLAEHARKADVEVRLDIFGGQQLQHTFQFSAGRAPEADEAIRRLAEWVRPKLGLADAAATAEAT
jgi:epsilon-lactone hydrolase